MVFSLGNTKIFAQYKDVTSKVNTITNEDLNSFNKIKELNIPKEKKVLIQMNKMNNVPFSSDGGSWLEYFTGLDTEVNFSEFQKEEALVIYDLYKNKQIDELYCNYDIRYIYWGDSQVFGSGVNKRFFDENSNLELIFNNSKSSFYKIKSIQCD